MDNEKFETMLNTLGDEFCQIMEGEKDNNFPEVFNLIVEVFGIGEDVKNIELNSKEPVITFLKNFYDFGFYTGVKFMLDPDDLHKKTLEKVYGAKF